MMVNFRENPQQAIDGSPVVLIKDCQKLEQRDMVTGEVTKLDMPSPAMMLRNYCTQDGTKGFDPSVEDQG